MTLFLMNDTVLTLDRELLDRPRRALRCDALTLEFVVQLGREIFARRPLLHREAPEGACRLAALIQAKSPDLNAALFCVTSNEGYPHRVESRLQHVPLRTLAALQARPAIGVAATLAVDRAVWRRLAA